MTITTVHSRSQHAHGRGGFSLMEVMIAMSIGVVLLGLATGGLLFLSRSLTTITQYAEMSQESRFALEVFGRDVRMSTRVHKLDSHFLAVDRAAAGGGNEYIEFVFDPDTETFARVMQDGNRQVMLTGVRELNINYFTVRGDPTVNPLEVKEVQLEALIQRRALTVAATNYIISAQFMLRNHSVTN